jgi:hypothetical protein
MHLPDIESIIHDTLGEIEMHSDDAVALLMGTGAVESRFEYLKQLFGGPARSWWQVEPSTAVDNIFNYLKYRVPTWEKVSTVCFGNRNMSMLKFDDALVEHLLEVNIAFAICMARIKYRRVPKALPDQLDIEGQADYWLRYYNAGGKGTARKYIDAFGAILD